FLQDGLVNIGVLGGSLCERCNILDRRNLLLQRLHFLAQALPLLLSLRQRLRRLFISRLIARFWLSLECCCLRLLLRQSLLREGQGFNALAIIDESMDEFVEP